VVSLDVVVPAGVVGEEAAVDPRLGTAWPKTMNTPEARLQLHSDMKCQIYEPSFFSTVSGDELYRLCDAIGARYADIEVERRKEV